MLHVSRARGGRGLFEASAVAAALAKPPLGQREKPGTMANRQPGHLANGRRSDALHPLCEPAIPGDASDMAGTIQLGGK
jgi:hypothetical protein